MSCLQCGTCCDPILLRLAQSEIRRDPSLEGGEFILLHWRRVSQREAFSKRPLLRQTHYVGRCYYSCDCVRSPVVATTSPRLSTSRGKRNLFRSSA